MENTISVTDIKHYFYCPKIVYFDKVIHAQSVLSSQQQEAKNLHKEKQMKDKYRKTMFHNERFTNCIKVFNVHMYSSSLGIEGIVDCIIKSTGDEYIPVDYKLMLSKKGRAWIDHKFQLSAYALLIEEHYSTKVKRGFVYYIPEDKPVEIEITETVKNHLKRTIKSIQNIIEKEGEPVARVPKYRCTGGCGYLWICGGIWNRRE